jgi:hypothetical protein
MPAAGDTRELLSLVLACPQAAALDSASRPVPITPKEIELRFRPLFSMGVWHSRAAVLSTLAGASCQKKEGRPVDCA